jgi:mono/diheme cytochrome c family protein
MKVTWVIAAALVAGLKAGPAAAQTAQTAAGQGFSSAGDALVRQYCVTCHSERLKTGGLVLEGRALDRVGDDPETWEKVVRKIRTGMMPPSGARRPERAQLDAFATDLEGRLDAAPDSAPTPGAPALHRLNRTEYANAIRDLLALDIDPAAFLPADDSSEGFDNLAESLGASPSLVQGYVSAAMKISRRAVGDRTTPPSQVTYPAPAGLSQGRHLDGMPLGTRGGFRVEHTFPLDAEYEISVNGLGGGFGVPPTADIDVSLDGARIEAKNPRTFRLKVSAGPHTVVAALVDRQRSAGVDDVYSDFRANAAFTPPGGIFGISISGPYDASGPGDTPSRRQIFVCHPPAAPRTSVAPAAPEEACARRIVTTLARRAFRQPARLTDIATLMTFYRDGRQEAGFEAGIQQALARILVSPRFLYRSEEPPPGPPRRAYRISSFDLASRLSFFLWSSIPDDELLELAASGRLNEPDVLRAQTRRMLADPKADALTRNFAGQWLFLRELAKVQSGARDFDENLRQSFRRESELFFDAIVREDRSILTLLDADFTFVDERLARHYGIPNVRGSYFRRVALDPDSPRRGLIGQGSVLTLTSVATRTSPVSRGKWILENLLGTPAPIPPPGVDTNLDKDGAAAATATLRQRLEQHRSNPVCASCHKIMDPIGFALENFDLIGAWRDVDGAGRVDATGQLVDGTPLNGPADLRRALLSRSAAFVTTAVEKLMTYALGRPLRYYDMPAVRAIVRRAAGSDDRFSSLVLGIVESEAFRTASADIGSRSH